MTSLDQKRRERALGGSRRKRDLEAVKPSVDWDAYAAEHFPAESPSLVAAAAFAVWARHQKREYPDPAEVRERLEEKGWLQEAAA